MHQNSEFEANRLNVIVTASVPEGSWSADLKALYTWDVEELIKWGRGSFKLEPLIQFADSEFEFLAKEVNEKLLHLQIHLDPAVIPPWYGGPADLELFVTPDDLKAFVHDLDQDLAGYPYRDPEALL